MKENNDFKSENSIENDNDARAVKESELLPIYDIMYFSGDIQPVEDFSVPDYEKSQPKNERTESKNTDTKKKNIPFLTVFNKIPKRILAVVLAVVIAASVLTAAVVGIVNGGKNESPVSSVYALENDGRLVLAGSESYSVSDMDSVRLSEDRMMLYYTRRSGSKTGKSDIRLINVRKKSSLKKEGSFIDNGIDEEWQINADGSLLCYTKTESGIKNLYAYNASTGKKEKLSTDVEDFCLALHGDVIYFTRRISSTYSLHRVRIGEQSHNVASPVDYVRFCNDDKGFEVLYTVQTGNELNVDVFLVSDFGEPVKVCEDVSEVYANAYTCKGNLYYFTKNNSTVNWQDFIDDPYLERDINHTKPLESDFLVERGFIFKRYVLDTVAYNAALSKYKAKQKRDAIRDELDKIDLGLAAKEDYTCFVYNGVTTKKLASGVVLENVISATPTGAPRIIYKKSVIAVENKIPMDKLVSLSSDGSVADAVDYVRERVSGSYDLSNDCIYSWYDGTKVLEYPVEDYDVKKTEFILATGSVMYALCDGELYYNSISQSGLSASTLIDTNVTSFSYESGHIYYTKAQSTDTENLHRFSVEDGKTAICDNIGLYVVADENFVILVRNQAAGSELVDVAVFENGRLRNIDTDVEPESFVCHKKTFAYLKNITTSEKGKSGEMYVFTADGELRKADEKVTKIVYISG